MVTQQSSAKIPAWHHPRTAVQGIFTGRWYPDAADEPNPKNLETVSTSEGTHDIHTLVRGRHLTGIPAFEPPAE
jgi:hypothetical protein